MDEINEFYKKIQMYLMKKNQECGELRFLNACITPENIEHVEDICKSMARIFEAHKIPINGSVMVDNEKCVMAYKYLLLNTNFNCQERLAEDITCGHLVDMLPPLSPFLFVQLVWTLQYDFILMQSFLYVPFDLCSEMLEVVTKCIERLPFKRIFDLVYTMTLVLYVKFEQLEDSGIQAKNVEQTVLIFLVKIEEFLLMISSSELPCLTELSDLKKHERYGIMLKKLIATIRQCLENKIEGIHIMSQLEKLYPITFGREPYIQCEGDVANNYRASLNKVLMNVLRVKVQEIDCNIYLHWAEIDDEDNCMITLQRSIGIECYYFIEFMKSDEKLAQDTRLIECLQHLASKPVREPSFYDLSIDEVCCGIRDGKKELMKELLIRYKEWFCRDREILNFIHDHKSLLDQKDCLVLLEYFVYIFEQPDEIEYKEHVYTVITRILVEQSVPDLYEIAVAYITKFEGRNFLEPPFMERVFNDFITQNTNLQVPDNLKTVLMFIMKNPKTILAILLKITIGHSRYENIMISMRDMFLLSPFMQIRDEDNEPLLTSCLRTICLENREWNGKKFMEILKIFLDRSLIEIHELINYVFIPYLREDLFNLECINSILNTILILGRTRTSSSEETKINVKDLIIVLGKKMTRLRANTYTSKYICSEIFVHMSRITDLFLDPKIFKVPRSKKKDIADTIESFIEPIDKLYFASLWYLTQRGVSITDMVEDYERRCFVVLNRIKEDPQTSESIRRRLANFNLLREDFLRHLIMRATELEFQRLGSEFTLLFWFVFGWYSEIDAYDQFLRITIEACCLSLEYPSIKGPNTFPFILRSVIRLCRMFMLLEAIKDKDCEYQIIISNVRKLDESIQKSPYVDLFNGFSSPLHDPPDIYNANYVQRVLGFYHHFTDRCLEFTPRVQGTTSIPRTPRVTRFYLTHEIICACLKVPATQALDCVRRINEIFGSN